MRFKYNPWVSLLAGLVLTTIIVLLCSGCGITAEAEAPSRFTSEYAGSVDGSGILYIITDTETGAQYLLADVAYGGALTKLEG